MEAKRLYSLLEKDFINPGLSDDWVQDMGSVSDFISENFKQRSMGLVCDNSKEINKVYTAVFPTDEVMNHILETKEKDVLLFVHHPSIWDITKAPEAFYQMNRQLLEKFKERRISIYNLHVPLDNYGKYSTSNTLARKLKIRPFKSFAPYRGGLAGVFGKTDFDHISQLHSLFEKVIGHKASLYPYGGRKIKNNTVAIVAGGGNSQDVLEEAAKEGINTFVTGITVKNDHSQQAHDFAKEKKITILGGTHYSTEKFACQEMCKYFLKLGLESEFIPGKPGLADL